MNTLKFILIYLTIIVIGLISEAKAQGIVKDDKGNYVQLSSQKTTVETAKKTDKTFTDKSSKIYPIYESKNGKLFVIRTSKNGNTYNMYLPK